MEKPGNGKQPGTLEEFKAKNREEKEAVKQAVKDADFSLM